jgi:uncharacterized protein YbjT (DUF2867 family)
VALVLQRPAEFAGRRVDIASDELTGAQLESVLSEATGRTIRYEQQSLELLWNSDADMAAMFRFSRLRDIASTSTNCAGTIRAWAGIGSGNEPRRRTGSVCSGAQPAR